MSAGDGERCGILVAPPIDRCGASPTALQADEAQMKWAVALQVTAACKQRLLRSWEARAAEEAKMEESGARLATMLMEHAGVVGSAAKFVRKLKGGPLQKDERVETQVCAHRYHERPPHSKRSAALSSGTLTPRLGA